MKLRHAATWKRRLASLLIIALVSNLTGVITPWAGRRNEARWSIDEIADLPDDVCNQQVSQGISEEELNLPEFLQVMTEPKEDEEASPSSARISRVRKATGSQWEQKATGSDSQQDFWEMVPVAWSFVRADNGLTSYDGNTPGTYTFEAELADERYEMGNSLLPIVTVEVKDESTEDETVEYISELIELEPITTSAAQSFFSLANGQVDLKSGNHELWIDRIDVPDYARDLYAELEEGADNDGTKDILIDDQYFDRAAALERSKSVFNGISFYSVKRDTKMSDDEFHYISDCISAAFYAFDRDHPEVFWLSGSSYVYSDGLIRTVGGKSTYEYTLYFVLKLYSDGGFDIRKNDYQNASAIKNAIRTRNQNVSTIMKEVSSSDTVDRIIGFNDWLTKHNAYNSDLDTAPESAWECTSALAGSCGEQGPVCEGYSRAFKVLCDKAGIPCVLVDGLAYGHSDEPHMWNYVKADNSWYAVDVTWNDPIPGSGDQNDAISGHEGTDWLLLGSDTLVEGESVGSQCSFIKSHPVSNSPSSSSPNYTNGPVLSADRYPLLVPDVTFNSAAQSVVYTGSAAQITPPSVTITDNGGNTSTVNNPAISYSYRADGATGYTSGLPVNAGTYTVKAHVKPSKTDGYRSADSSNTLSLTITRASRTIPAPAVAGQTDSSVTLRNTAPSAGANDGKVEYACSTDGSIPGTGWQTSPVITGLKRNTTYHFFARVTGGKNYTDATSAGTAGKTDKTRLPKPSLKQATYAYTGDTVAIELKNFDPAIMTVIGNTATERGDYQATITLSSGDYLWEDNTSSAIYLDWKIMRGRTLSALTFQADSITENGVILESVHVDPAESAGDGKLEYGYATTNDQEKAANWQDSTKFTGLESGTTYYFFARIIGGREYTDVISNSVSVTTRKISLAKPVLTDSGSYVYQSSVIEAAVKGYQEDTMTISGNRAVNAGNYTTKISLKDTRHYEWEDGSGQDISFNWKITKKPVTVKAADISKSYGSDNPALTLEDLPAGLLAGSDTIEDLKVTLSTTADKYSAAGSYPITGISAAENYEVTILPGTLTITRRSSGGGGGGGGGGGTSTTTTVTTGGPGSNYTISGSWQSGTNGWKFLKNDGSYASDTWGYINNKWYYFDANSDMVTGWYPINGQWYYMNPAEGAEQGVMITGWHFDPVYQAWFYLSFNGNMTTGWQQVGEKWYYLNPTPDGTQGTMATNTYIDGYYVGADGAWIP